MRSAMARSTICTLWISVLCASGICLTETVGQDLEPEQGVFGSRMSPYEDAVAAILLGLNKYDRRECQMVFLPSFGPESAVYILRSDDGKETKASVVSVKMQQQLWGQIQEFLRKEALEAGKTSWSIGPVDERRALGRASHEVQRAEAEVDGQTGNLLDTVWQGMLWRVQYHMKDESSLGLDGESFHAAHFLAGAGFITGQTWSPEKGTRTYDFVELAKALRNYVQANGADRKAVLPDVRSKAEALVQRLKSGS